ncbi:related to Ubiquinone biosynthesis protein COQ9, mitochondrial [Saccharomycodes ludwigii]|uniref:Ubiquinone biosynthesis protein n=1 Tax=Saccharomycodes ludwigii TaxID=36035 RepID=A0A376B4U3_9ASCO|nr:related to Ubiquinone biosynthesis protein COQ9, mitochondrial [Saccharomycodes ludwigii]
MSQIKTNSIITNVFNCTAKLTSFKKISLIQNTHRFYHPNTTEYPKPHSYFPYLTYAPDSIQAKILSNCLQKHVPNTGINERSLINSCNDLGQSSTMLSVLSAPSNSAVLELIKFHLVTSRLELFHFASKNDKSLEEIFLKRLELNKPISNQLSALLSHLTSPFPSNLDVGIQELHNLSNDFVVLANDIKESHDFAWYSKRMGLSVAYVSSELFMAQDKSENFKETMEFAKRRLDNWRNYGTMYNNTEEFLWFQLMSGLSFVRSQTA